MNTTERKIDFEQANRIACTMIQRIVPGGRMLGHDYVVRSPLRQDNNPGSFRVNLKHGYYKDFATNDAGDLVDLFAKINNLSMIDAAKQLLGDFELPAETKKIIENFEGDVVFPIEESFMDFNFEHFQHGLPSKIYKYCDISGQLMFVIARYDKKTGGSGKAIIPWTLRRFETKRVAWKAKAFPTPRVLYNLDKLANNPNLPVVIVEGEKCADALQKMVSEFVVTTWSGGSQAVDKTDFTPLFGRTVYLWADNDEPGQIAVEKIASILVNKSHYKFCKIPLDKPQGWDAADAVESGMKKDDIIQIINPQTPELARPYRTLGHDRGTYFVFPKGASQIIGIPGASLGKKTFLMIAPLHYWEDEFPSKNGVDWDVASDHFIRECERKGAFDPSRVRGRGCWIDAERLIIHLGDKLQQNGLTMGLDDLNTRYIYETRPAIGFPDYVPAMEEEGQQVYKIFNLLRWENTATGALVAGWVFLAPVCGVLDWRPHGWITGPAGAGKSWVLNKIIYPLLGELVVYALGGSSSAGIVQKLQSDAIPVIIEEAESDNQKQKFQMEDILTIARQSSSDTGANIFKGTQQGKFLSYALRSMFLFNSIGVNVKHHADDTRVTIFGLTEDRRSDKTAKFMELSKLVHRILTDDFCRKIRARAIKLVPVIKQNTRLFCRLAGEILNSQRAGDQLGTLLAGAYTLINDKAATEDDALLYLKSFDLSEASESKEITDESSCLKELISHQLRITTVGNRTLEMTLGELIEIVVYQKMENTQLSIDDAINILKRTGIIIDYANERVIFAYNSKILKRILLETAWQNNYGLILRRLPTAIYVKDFINFCSGIRDKGVSIAADYIFKGLADERFV